MIALAAGLAIALIGTVGVIVWLVAGRIDAADAAADARVALAKQDAELGRAKYERDQIERAFKAADARAIALEEIIREDVEAAPDPAVARTGVRGRLLRFAQRWSAADADRNGAVPAPAAGERMPPDQAPEAPQAPAVSARTGPLP